MSTEADKLVLYTNHLCPFAHRLHIAVNELKIPYEEVVIDLFRPRDPWYLEINPRGLVPAVKYQGEIVTESGIIANLLTDAYPSHLVPESSAPGGALRRARIAFFADTFSNKFQNLLYGTLKDAKTEEESVAIEQQAVAAAVKEIEPLLADAAPFFGGSDKLTLAEVQTASFALRLLVSLDAGGIYSDSFAPALEKQAPNFWKWAKTVSAHPSVAGLLDEQQFVDFSRKKVQEIRSKA